MAIKSNLVDSLKKGFVMIKKYLKVIVLSFMVSGFNSFSNGDDVEDVEGVLLKPLKSYKTLEEVTSDLELLNNGEISLRCQGKLSQVSAVGMVWKRTALQMLQKMNNIQRMIACVYKFLQEKRREYRMESEYIEEIERIYQDQGASDTEEMAFHENIIFLKEIRSIRWCGPEINRELAAVNGLLQGVSFWKES
ncbi:MAG: hypothetical protein LBD60_00810 [Puniceicoccales bacterium]|nr:hypothetical protein [Puniceicoccales bacterium]